MLKKLFRFTRNISKFKLALFAIILIAILYGSYISFFKASNQEIQTQEVKSGNIKSYVSASGTISGKDIVNLKFKTSGKLVFLNFNIGDSVFQGQTLAGQDNQDLNINLQQTLNTLRDKQAIADKVLDDIHLFQYGNGGFGNVGSINETMTQRQLRTSAEVLRDNAFDSVKLAQRAFEDIIITSPIDGKITKNDYFVGQFVSPADTIYQIVNWGEIFFDAEVDESEISKIKIGQQAEIELNSYPDQKFMGEVDEISPQTKTTSSGATVVIVRIKLHDISISEIMGLNGQVNIIVTEIKDVLTVPQQAIFENENILLKSPEGYKEVKIITGISSDTEIEIKEGLSSGDQIVLNPSDVNKNQKNIISRFFRF